jgi:hypothetical protein
MRQLKTIEELTKAVYVNLDAISPRNKSTFWAQLSKLLQHERWPLRTNHYKHGLIKVQLDSILMNTLNSMGRFDDRDIATIAIILVKIVK